MEKCEICYNSRTVLTENGFKQICCLSQKKAMQCILDITDYCVVMRKEIDNGKID